MYLNVMFFFDCYVKVRDLLDNIIFLLDLCFVFNWMDELVYYLSLIINWMGKIFVEKVKDVEFLVFFVINDISWYVLIGLGYFEYLELEILFFFFCLVFIVEGDI